MQRRPLLLAAAFLIGFAIYLKWDAVIGIAAVLIYTAMFSLILAPLCTRMERRGIRKACAAAFTVLGLSLMVVLLFAAFIPYLAVRAADLFKRVSPLAIDILRRMTMWAETFAGTNALLGESGGVIGMTVSSAAGMLFRTGMNAASQIGRMGFSLILTYYVLCDRRRIGLHLLLIIPLAWRKEIQSILFACRNALMSYFSGMLKTCGFVAAATGFGLVVLDVEDALLLAMLMGLFEVLPYIGPILASVPILLSAMLQGGNTALIVLVMLVLIQQIEGSIISPYFTACSTSVHPLAAVFSVFAAGALLGIWGVLFAIPAVVLGQTVISSAEQMRRAIKSVEWSC